MPEKFSGLEREPIVDTKTLTVPVEHLDEDGRYVYVNGQGSLTLFTVNLPMELSHYVGAPRPRVVVVTREQADGDVTDMREGLLLGTSLTGDGDRIDEFIPPSGSDLAPIALERVEDTGPQLLVLTPSSF